MTAREAVKAVLILLGLIACFVVGLAVLLLGALVTAGPIR